MCENLGSPSDCGEILAEPQHPIRYGGHESDLAGTHSNVSSSDSVTNEMFSRSSVNLLSDEPSKGKITARYVLPLVCSSECSRHLSLLVL